MSFVRRPRRIGRAGIPAAGMLLALAAIGDAQVRPAQRAPQAPARATEVASIEGVTEYSLPNGLRILLFPDQSKSSITVNVLYHVGSAAEGYGETGAAHLIEHLVLRGSKNHPDAQREFTAHGARRNASTYYDRTYYFQTVPATDENLDWVLDVEADRMVNASITRKDLESEFSVVRNELELNETDLPRVMFFSVFRAAYAWHGYRHSTVGAKSDIENMPVERLQAFYKKHYQPDNAVLIVSGKFDPAKTLRVIERKFGSIPRPRRSHANGNMLDATYTAEPTQDGERVVYVRRVGDTQMLVTGHHIPSGTHPDAGPLAVLGEMFHNSPSGRLYKALVEPRLAASVSAFHYRFRDPSLFMMQVNVRVGQSLDSARTALEKAVEDARTGSFTTEEVERAKTALARGFDVRTTSSDLIALDLAEAAAIGDWRMFFLHRDRVAAVTPADVKRVAAAYLKPANRSMALFIPTPTPDRAEIPATPNVAAMLAGYKGRAAVQAGEAFDASPRNIESRTKRIALPNGAHVTMLPKLTRASRVVASMQFRHGTEQSLTGKSAVSSLTAAMLQRGTTALTRAQVQDSLNKIKAVVVVSGTGSVVNVQVETTRPSLLPALEIIAQMLRSPRFDAEEFEKLKKERLVALEANRSVPVPVALTAMNRRLLVVTRGHPLYTATAEEQIEDINAVTHADLKAFHAGFYGASNADFAFVGDFDAAEVGAAVTRLFGDWKNPEPYVRLGRTYVKTDSVFESIETPDKTNAISALGTTVEIKDDDPDYPALVLGTFMFGGNVNSRMSRRIRDKEGLSYGQGAALSVQAQVKYGTWIANGIHAPQNADRFLAVFRQELDSVLKHGFDPAEVEQNKTGYMQLRATSRANDPELVGLLVTRRFTGRTMAYDANLDAKIAALTADQVNAVFRKYVDPKNLIIVRAGDFAKNPPVKSMP